MPAGTNGNKLGRHVVMLVPDIFFYYFHFIQKINIDAKPIMNLIGWNFKNLFPINHPCDGIFTWLECSLNDVLVRYCFGFFCFVDWKSKMAVIARQYFNIRLYGENIFFNYSSVKPLNHLLANMARMFLQGSFTIFLLLFVSIRNPRLLPQQL